MFNEASIDALSRVFLLAVAVLVVAGASFAQREQFLTTKEALTLAFPKCEIDRQERVLDERGQAAVEALCGQRPPRATVYAYRATRDGEVVGTAWFDRHRVRSKQELLMVVVDPRGRIARVEVLSFEEPAHYMPRGDFYRQLLQHTLTDELSTERAIRPVAGATLTVNATVAAVRRVLAVHRVVFPGEVPAEQPERPEQEQPAGERRREQSGDVERTTESPAERQETRSARPRSSSR